MNPDPSNADAIPSGESQAIAGTRWRRSPSLRNLPNFVEVRVALLDSFMPEFATFLGGESIDLYLTPWPRRAPGPSQYRWPVPSSSKSKTSWFTAIRRAIYSRWAERKSLVPAQTRLKTSEWLARAYARKLPKNASHLFVSQDLLPFLWRLGVLDGKTYDVLLTRPPLKELNKRLDKAAEAAPAAISLHEFRAAWPIAEAEELALARANRVVTPHADYASLFENVRRLEWEQPQVEPPPEVPVPQYLLLPASLEAVEGAYSVIEASRSMELPLLVIGSDREGLAGNSDTIQFITEDEVPWHEIAAVVHPALFESTPRLHLKAKSLGLPVVVTEGCGLEEGDGVMVVGYGDSEGLIRSLERALGRERINDPLEIVPSETTEILRELQG